MHGAEAGPKRRGVPAFRLLVHLVGVTVTVSYLYWLWALCFDLPSAHGADYITLLVGFLVPPLLLGLPIAYRCLVLPGGPGAPPATGSTLGRCGDDRFWSKHQTRRLYVGHLVSTLVQSKRSTCSPRGRTTCCSRSWFFRCSC